MSPLISKLLTLFFPATCAGCGSTASALCKRCKQEIPFLSPDSGALFDYAHPIVRRAIHALKYYGRQELMRDLLLDLPIRYTGVIHLVPIPLSKKRYRERGYNQSEVITRIMKTILPLAVISTILKKTRETTSQVKTTTRKQRVQNINRSMLSLPADPTARYIIVDDVITTGATIAEAIRALRAAGAVYIEVCAVAYNKKRRP